MGHYQERARSAPDLGALLRLAPLESVAPGACVAVPECGPHARPGVAGSASPPLTPFLARSRSAATLCKTTTASAADDRPGTAGTQRTCFLAIARATLAIGSRSALTPVCAPRTTGDRGRLRAICRRRFANDETAADGRFGVNGSPCRRGGCFSRTVDRRAEDAGSRAGQECTTLHCTLLH
jgi:hypothetical protein